MACDCMQKLDQRLADGGHNTKIARTYVFEPFSATLPTIRTEKADPANRKKPVAMMPSYCPWCGLSYKTGEPGKVKEAATS